MRKFRTVVPPALFALAMLAAADARAVLFQRLVIPNPPDVVNGLPHKYEVAGISGSTVFGSYYASSGFTWQGFISDGTTTTAVIYPGLSGPSYEGTTIAAGSDGRYICWTGPGNTDNLTYASFLFDGTSFQPISVPNEGHTVAESISGSTIVGYDWGGPFAGGFIYDGTNYTTVRDPLAIGPSSYTELLGFFGNQYVGNYVDSSSTMHGFFYDGSPFTSLLNPLDSQWRLKVVASDGHTILGTYQYDAAGDSTPFLYNGTTFTPFSAVIAGYDPLVTPTGIWGENIVGVSDGNYAVIATVPEPSALALLLAAGASLPVVARRRRNQTRALAR